jgi:hypothetical protein
MDMVVRSDCGSLFVRPGDIFLAERMIPLVRQGSKQRDRKLLRDEGQ